MLNFVLFAPDVHVRFHIFILVRLTERPPIGNSAARSAYDLLVYDLVSTLFSIKSFATTVFGVGISF